MPNPLVLIELCRTVSIVPPQLSSTLDSAPVDNDLDTVQILHHRLYPILFRYVHAFVRDTAIADGLIVELFFEMLKNGKIDGNFQEVTVGSLQLARQICMAHLSEKSTLSAADLKFTSTDFNEVNDIDLLMFNAMSPIQKELVWLRDGFGLTLAEIATILDLPYLSVILTAAKIAETIQK